MRGAAATRASLRRRRRPDALERFARIAAHAPLRECPYRLRGGSDAVSGMNHFTVLTDDVPGTVAFYRECSA